MPVTHKKILVVDDSVMQLQVTCAALEMAGYGVSGARDLAELEARRAEGGYDLILMDVTMPEAFGDDVANILKAVRGETSPIYLFSSLDPADLRERAAEAELDGWLSKRDGVEALVARVSEILR